MQQTKLDKYSLLRDEQGKPTIADTGEGTAQSQEDDETRTLQDALVTIQGVKEALELKLDSVSTELTLVHADLHSMSDQVKDTEVSLASIQAETAFLQTQVKGMCATME
ncbi:hypothetical protein NDU88_003131 [Pleurodeles waltl]|uniref:Uncharacterized protein n=1 Tax=Pleurodeles waltl TaxID=8319 RepID=A0AAV7RES6_PLEWA|nr:hypothetical protein NDU88_003131 [Pleurodeles waltl]